MDPYLKLVLFTMIFIIACNSPNYKFRKNMICMVNHELWYHIKIVIVNCGHLHVPKLIDVPCQMCTLYLLDIGTSNSGMSGLRGRNGNNYERSNGHGAIACICTAIVAPTLGDLRKVQLNQENEWKRDFILSYNRGNWVLGNSSFAIFRTLRIHDIIIGMNWLTSNHVYIHHGKGGKMGSIKLI